MPGGCAELHTVYVYDRGGMTRVAQLTDISQVRWSRDRDGISEANIRIEGSACSAQAATLAAIEPKRNELVIFRGDDRVWEGPVWRVGWHSDRVEVNAHDIFQYVMETPLSQAYNNAYPNIVRVTQRLSTILGYELNRWEALSPPANIKPYLAIHDAPNGPKTSSNTKPFEMTVGEHIQHLAHYGGIDFAAIGRSLHIWDVDKHLGETRRLTEADFLGSEVIITAYGAQHAQHAYVVGEDGKYGEAHQSKNEAYYGPWTRIYSAFTEAGGTGAPDQEELDSQALRNLAGRTPVPVEVRVPDNSSIRLDETLTIQDLVPGVAMNVLATLNARQLSQKQKLDHLQVTEDGDGENVQITLVPATHDVDDDPEED